MSIASKVARTCGLGPRLFCRQCTDAHRTSSSQRGSAEVGAFQPSSAALSTTGVSRFINAKQQKPQRNANYVYLCATSCQCSDERRTSFSQPRNGRPGTPQGHNRRARGTRRKAQNPRTLGRMSALHPLFVSCNVNNEASSADLRFKVRGFSSGIRHCIFKCAYAHRRVAERDRCAVRKTVPGPRR